MKTSNSQKKTGGIKKPFTQGTPVDTETWKKALFFFGTLLMVYFVSLIVCSMTGFSQTFLRIGVNLVIIVGILLIFYNNGANYGENAVARGEIVWQRKEKQENVSDSEVRLSYHPLKGLIMAAAGTLPFFILALVLALTTSLQTSSQGTIPGWLQSYLGRDEIGGALTAYTNPRGLTAVELIRVVVRIMILPYINLAGTAANKMMTLWMERLSPVIVLLPAIAYGIGFIQGPGLRSRVHTEIAENTKKRIRREKRERRLRRQSSGRSGPQQLN